MSSGAGIRIAGVVTTGALAAALCVVPSAASPVVVGTLTRNLGATAGVVGSTSELAVRVTGLDAGFPVTFRFGEQESTGTTDATGLARVAVRLPDAAAQVPWTARFPGTASDSSVSYAASEHSGTFAVTPRELRLSAPAQSRSGAPVAVTVTALRDGGEVDQSATGTPVLTTTDTHATAGSCGSYRSGVAECSGLVLRDLGRQVLTAVDEEGRGGAQGGALVVAPDGVHLLAYERQVEVGRPAEFLVSPRAAGQGLTGGYAATSSLRATTGEATSAPCVGSGCRMRLTFDTLGPRDVVATEGQGGLVSEPVRVEVTPNAECKSGVPVSLDRSLITATGSAGVTVREDPKTLVDLYAYTRPSTQYRLIRSATTDERGLARFTVVPPANTRLLASQRHQNCRQPMDGPASAVLDVRTALTLTAARNGPRDYTFAGDSLPARPGGLIVSLYRITQDGRQILAGQSRADAKTGQWVVRRTFTGTGRFAFVARTGQDLQNAPGNSNVRSTLIY